jgi:hypothetical protein
VKTVSTAIAIAIAYASAASAAVQSELHGKSLIMSWSESRVQKDGGSQTAHTVNGQHALRLYISTAGRFFGKITNTTRAGSGSREREPSAISGSGSGTQLTVIMGRGQGGGVRRISVSFDSGFQRCTAKIARAKEVGKAAIVVDKSPITNARVEILSVTVSGESCSVQAGNVLGQ